MAKYKNKWIYAVYKGETFLAEGTREEICKELNIKNSTFYYYRYNAWQKRCENGNNHRTIIRIDNN